MTPLTGDYAMDLLLWRHAVAEDGPVDFERALTKRGEKQALLMARWLKAYMPKNIRILVSPSVRTRQTADALALPYETNRRLAPDAGVTDLIAAAEWPTAKSAVLLVGHQPGLGNLASLLISGHEAPMTIKKGAMWWLSNRVREGESQTVLRAVISPDFLAE